MVCYLKDRVLPPAHHFEFRMEEAMMWVTYKPSHIPSLIPLPPLWAPPYKVYNTQNVLEHDSWSPTLTCELLTN